MKQVNLKYANFKRNMDQKTYTIHHSHFDYEKLPKQDKQVKEQDVNFDLAKTFCIKR